MKVWQRCDVSNTNSVHSSELVFHKKGSLQPINKMDLAGHARHKNRQTDLSCFCF